MVPRDNDTYSNARLYEEIGMLISDNMNLKEDVKDIRKSMETLNKNMEIFNRFVTEKQVTAKLLLGLLTVSAALGAIIDRGISWVGLFKG